MPPLDLAGLRRGLASSLQKDNRVNPKRVDQARSQFLQPLDVLRDAHLRSPGKVLRPLQMSSPVGLDG
jgi:hypothetical protein